MFKLVVVTTLSIALNAYSITIPKESLVFNAYKETVPAADLTEYSIVTVIENDAEYEAPIYNLDIKEDSVSFEVLDYTDLKIVHVPKPSKRTKKYSFFALSRSLLPMAILGLAGLPAVDGAGICYAACVTGCYAACAALSIATASPACLAVANAGGCPLACSGAAAIPLPWC